MGFYDADKVGEPDEEIELDLTNSHLASLEGVVVRQTLEYVDLTANRLRAVPDVLLQLKGLKFLCFRQNLIADASPISSAGFKFSLQDLYFNDNQLTQIPDLSGFSRLRRLEFSYNHQIRSLEALEHVSGEHLVELYCAENKIPSIQSLAHLTNLTILELGSNRIQEIEHLDTLTKLDELWLGRNRIAEIKNLEALTSVRQVSLQANRLESMRGIGVMTGLEELYLSQNGITRIEALQPLTKLSILDLAHNAIETVEGLETLERLSDLWLNDNPVKDLDHIAEAVQACRDTLTVVYLENTPAAKSSDAYLHIMKQMLPKLEYLDSTRITR